MTSRNVQKKWIHTKFSSHFKGTLRSKARGKVSSQQQLQATRRGSLQCLLASWRGLFTPLARLGVIMAKPHVSGDSLLFGHHFISGVTLNRMCGCGHKFVLQRQCIPFWPCTILCCFSHNSCGRIKHGRTQNSFFLCSPLHTENIYWYSFFCWLVQSSNQLLEARRLK